MFNENEIFRINERFIKDYRVSIDKGIAYTEYFKERLEQYNKYSSNIIDKYNKTVDEICNCFEDVESYYSYRNALANKLITLLCDNEDKYGFSGNDGTKKIKKEYKTNQHNIPNKGCCKDTLLKESLISIDLKSANFTALRYFNSKIVEDYSCYDEFIKKYSYLEHIIESKYFRQRVFGKAGVSNQTTIEKFLTGKILEELLTIIPKEDIISFNNDEIILYENKNLKDVIAAVENVSNILNINTHIEKFTLYKISGTKDAYLKKGNNITKDNEEISKIYGVSPVLFPFVLSELYNEDIKDSYKYFRNTEKCLSKMIEIPKIKIEY